jgi:hypothetical protein
VRIRVDPPALLDDLCWHFERAGFDVQRLASDSIAVRRLDAPSEAQARREIGIHLRIWEATHPDAWVTRSPS